MRVRTGLGEREAPAPRRASGHGLHEAAAGGGVIVVVARTGPGDKVDGKSSEADDG